MQSVNQNNHYTIIRCVALFLPVLVLLNFQLCSQPSTQNASGIQVGQYANVTEAEYSEMKSIALELLNTQPLVTLATINLNGYPEARVMGNLYPQLITKKVLGANSLNTYFAGSIHTDKVNHIRNNPRASVYIVDNTTFKAVTLTGTLSIVEDKRDKEAVWDDRFLGMYPGGSRDTNFCCFRFDARTLKVHRGKGSPTVLIKP